VREAVLLARVVEQPPQEVLQVPPLVAVHSLELQPLCQLDFRLAAQHSMTKNFRAASLHAMRVGSMQNYWAVVYPRFPHSMMEPTAPSFPNCLACLNKRFEKVQGFEFEQPHYSSLGKPFLVRQELRPSLHKDNRHNKALPTMDPTMDKKRDPHKKLRRIPT
jgi:hypothetical protein